MIALEALREAVVELDQVTGDLEDCITCNKEAIYQAHVLIDTRIKALAHHNHLVGKDLYKRTSTLQTRCQWNEYCLEQDRALLVLYC